MHPLADMMTAQRLAATPGPAPLRVALLGGAGALGAAVLEALLAAPGAQVQLALADGAAPLRVAVAGLQALPLSALAAEQAVVVLDAPAAPAWRGGRYARALREAVLHRPTAAELPALARALQACGVRSLVVVNPAAQASVPGSVGHGPVGAAEQALLQLGFAQLVLIRPAHVPPRVAAQGALAALAGWVLGAMALMVPQMQRPLRTAQVAALTAAAVQALRDAGEGSFVADAPRLWQLMQGTPLSAGVRQWLRIDPPAAAEPAVAALGPRQRKP